MIICGLDECGRGSLAGPLVAAAVTIHTDIQQFPTLLPVPLRDSKKLTDIQKNKIYDIRKQLPITYKIEEISVAEINEKGIGWANKEIFERLMKKIKARVYIIDGNLKFLDRHVQTLIKGDDKCYQVMLASIIGKVYRDNLLKKIHKDFPQYGWDKNAGYGSASHIQALRDHGLTPHHRIQFCTTALSH